MTNNFCKMPLWECSRVLSSTALGITKAETVITNAKLINVCTKEIQENISVAIACGRIALVGDAAHCIGPDTNVIDAQGQYIAPGLLDGHIHVESSMLSVGEYAKAVVPHGTTGIYYDPHEICNVLGLDGVNLMVKDAERTPLKAMLTTPSCVPAVPGFEDSGSVMTSTDVASEMERPEVVGLGEMMNFPGIINSVEETHKITGNTLKADKVVTGHFSIPETGPALNSYIASGVRCCHESTRAEDALAKMRLGMYAQFREGSAWHDLGVLAPALTENKIDSRFACLISDDTHPYTLLNDGHMDHIIRRAQSYGIDAITAVQMATINAAQCYRMDNELGSIAPGKCADIIFVDDLPSFHVTKVMIDGDVVAENGKMLNEFAPYSYPDWAMQTMHVGETITADTFKVRTDKKDTATVRVIEIIPAHVSDYERHVQLAVKNGCLESDVSQDVLKTFVFERHHNTGTHGVGFVKGFNIKCGAMASTVAHDAHNLLVVGTNDEDMAVAAERVRKLRGGSVVVDNGEVIAEMQLEIAGLMTTVDAETLGEQNMKVRMAAHSLGAPDNVEPFMNMAFVSLPVIPSLKMSTQGLIDVESQERVDLFI